MTAYEIFDTFLDDPMIMGSEYKEEKIDLLSNVVQESGLFGDQNEEWRRLESDFDSILTGRTQETVSSAFDKPLSDTSSDSGCNLEQQLLSPEPSVPNHPVDLIEYISNHDEDEDETPLHVNPRTNSPDSDNLEIMPTPFETGATTIILPVISPKSVKVVKTQGSKRRRVSASSSDSGLDELVSNASASKPVGKKSKYPPLELSEEEKRICEREGIKLPTHYPLSREEERNLKRIRRKIRNKLSAQDSRKRKKEYLDSMEDRVRQCTDENEELHKRIEQLETQNKTLAGQLKRLHQIIVNGGFTTRQNQTSTAMMVLLLSTALFLFPGFREHQESQKSEIDITRAVKMPPMPGQSRSLLQFNPTIKEEFNVNENTMDTKTPTINIKTEAEAEVMSSPFHDHDYFMVGQGAGSGSMHQNKKFSYIEADVPPQGYGYDTKDGILLDTSKDDVFVVLEDENESKLNVNVTGSGTTRTVVLHVPKDMK